MTVVATSTISPALLRSQFVNHDNTSAVLPQEPSRAAAPIYPPEIDEAASSDNDFQGLGADDDSSEPVLECQPFSTKTKASPTFVYPGFMHTIDQNGQLLY